MRFLKFIFRTDPPPCASYKLWLIILHHNERYLAQRKTTSTDLYTEKLPYFLREASSISWLSKLKSNGNLKSNDAKLLLTIIYVACKVWLVFTFVASRNGFGKYYIFPPRNLTPLHTSRFTFFLNLCSFFNHFMAFSDWDYCIFKILWLFWFFPWLQKPSVLKIQWN